MTAPTPPTAPVPAGPDDLARTYLAAGRLYGLQADLTWRCPLDCAHCYLGRAREGTGELDFDTWSRIFRQAADLGVWSLLVSGGEPMVRPDFWSLLDLARDLRFHLRVKTSGWLLDDRAADRLAGLRPLVVEVSVHGVRPATHDAFTGVPGSHARALAAIRALHRRGVAVGVPISLTAANASEVPDLQRLLDAEGIESSVAPVLIPAKDGRDLDPLAADPDLAAAILRARRGPYVPPATPELDTPVCGAGRATLQVRPDGVVFPCVTWPRVLGDLRTQSLADVVGGEALARVRALRHRDRDPACRSCPDLAVCAFCPGQSDLEHGDPTRPNPGSCALAVVQARLARPPEVPR